MRNQHFEVPFIAFYRKEYVLPELNVNDLWKVYKYDAKVSKRAIYNILSIFNLCGNILKKIELIFIVVSAEIEKSCIIGAVRKHAAVSVRRIYARY